MSIIDKLKNLGGKGMDVKISAELENLMKDKGIKKEEVQEIINKAESSGNKLKSTDGELCIAKGEFENLTVYAMYSASELKDVYTHKMKILGLTGGELADADYDDESDWVCAKTGEPALERNVDMNYMGVTRPGPGIVCPNGSDFYVSPGVAKTLTTAESVLEEKRA